MSFLVGLLFISEIICPSLSHEDNTRRYGTQQERYHHLQYPFDNIDNREHYGRNQQIPHEQEAKFDPSSMNFVKKNNSFSLPQEGIRQRHRPEDGVEAEPKRSAVQQREIHTNEFRNGQMLYPDWSETNNERKRNTIPPGNCTYGFCDEVVDYPTDKILTLLKRNPSLKQYFSSSNLVQIPTIGNRAQFDGESLCDVKTHTKFPKSAKNINNREMKIVNVEGHQQGIVFETCGNEKGACRYSEVFPDDYETICVQKFVQRRLMVVGNADENLLFDTFEFPSCCICTIKKK